MNAPQRHECVDGTVKVRVQQLLFNKTAPSEATISVLVKRMTNGSTEGKARNERRWLYDVVGEVVGLKNAMLWKVEYCLNVS